MSSPRSRSVGLLLGLCAGDRNGGPQRMALRVAEAFAAIPAGVESCLGCLLRRYFAWRGETRFGAGLPPEYDLAYDTGVVFEEAWGFKEKRLFPPCIFGPMQEESSSSDGSGVLDTLRLMAGYSRLPCNQCLFFTSASGCKQGDACAFCHHIVQQANAPTARPRRGRRDAMRQQIWDLLFGMDRRRAGPPGAPPDAHGMRCGTEARG
eukprot:s1824_g3.t1